MVEFNQFKARMEPTTVVVQNVSTPRVKKPRPVNWRDITWDYMSYNDIHRTIHKYNLKDHNEKLSYSILPRWRQQYHTGYEAGTYIKPPVYGYFDLSACCNRMGKLK